MIINSYRFGDSAPIEPNTFIGGVGATSITSAADFVALTTGLVVGNIQNFQIDGSNNVSFFVSVDYALASGSFSGDTNITCYIDVDGKLTGRSGAFINCSNLEYVYMPNSFRFGQDFDFNNATSMLRVNFDSITISNYRFNMSDAPSMEKLSFPSMTEIGDDTAGTLCEMENLTHFGLHALTTIGQGHVERSMIHIPARFPNFIYNSSTATSPKFYINSALGVQDRAAFTRINAGFNVSDTVTVNGLLYTAIAGSPSTDGEFQAGTGNSVTDLTNFCNAVRDDGRTGTDFAAGIDYYQDGNVACLYCTTNGAGGNAIQISFSATGGASAQWSPFKYGNDVHPCLIDNKYTDGVTMVEVSAPITVNVPTGLSSSSVTSSGFDINFTAPTANANGTELYEVWVAEKNNPANPINYFYYQDVTATGATITGLESEKTYIVKMRTQDGHMNFSDFSSSFEVTTS